MSIDAMYWVWNQSQSKGTGRHVMLACANWITGPDCTVRASTAELVQFSNAARSSVIKAVDALVKSGELQLLEEARGTRAALYKIPGAVGYVRPERGSRGPKTGPLDGGQGSGIETPGQDARGPESGPQGSENETPRGPKTGPHKQHHRDHVEEEASSVVSAREFSSEEMKEYGNFWLLHPKSRAPDDTLALWKLAIASGVDPKKITAAAAAYAKEKAGEQWRFIKQSDNWLRERRYEDKFAPEPDATGRPPLRAVAGGWQPYEDPTDQSVYDKDL
ncbi:hypothetical protein ACIRJM_23160 [Streptomyces sp. NPDC102405]|uniref:hypothetical protein n=1 Tax=Streptomyces sp. NPDC102405 TaxID=3366170 RepID=UPI003817DDEB